MDEIWISTSNGLCFEVSVKDIRTLEKEIFERIFSGEPSICLDYFHSDVSGKHHGFFYIHFVVLHLILSFISIKELLMIYS